MRVHHIGITAKDLGATAGFYKNNFGFTEVGRFTKPGWDGSAIVLELGNMQLEIFGFKATKGKKDDLSDLKITGIKHIGIQVNSVKDKYKELKGRGIDIDEPAKGTTCAWFCFLRDPNGIPIELYEANV